jgi:hypothetical protein
VNYELIYADFDRRALLPALECGKAEGIGDLKFAI